MFKKQYSVQFDQQYNKFKIIKYQICEGSQMKKYYN